MFVITEQDFLLRAMLFFAILGSHPAVILQPGAKRFFKYDSLHSHAPDSLHILFPSVSMLK